MLNFRLTASLMHALMGDLNTVSMNLNTINGWTTIWTSCQLPQAVHCRHKESGVTCCRF